MNRCCVQDDENLSANTNRLLSDNTLYEKKAKLRSEAREQCCFCLLFSGAVVGTSVAAGLLVPAVSSIPYVGWLAGGWALLLGQKAGSELGSQAGSVFNDC